MTAMATPAADGNLEKATASSNDANIRTFVGMAAIAEFSITMDWD